MMSGAAGTVNALTSRDSWPLMKSQTGPLAWISGHRFSPRLRSLASMKAALTVNDNEASGASLAKLCVWVSRETPPIGASGRLPLPSGASAPAQYVTPSADDAICPVAMPSGGSDVPSRSMMSVSRKANPKSCSSCSGPPTWNVGVQLDELQRVAAVLAEGPFADRLASSQRRKRCRRRVVRFGRRRRRLRGGGCRFTGRGGGRFRRGDVAGTLVRAGTLVAGTGTTTLVSGAGPLVGGMVVLVGADSARGMQATSTAPSRAAIQTRGENPPRWGRFERRVGFTAVAP